ncbi:hypothetical protein J2755_001368 [Methanohalophilus levihalophilus]|uniref:COG1361 S-layer family protein n=1 Tax=Methanohalophilus levihalophilus TaxID=1431282 RepID=UPI001AE57A1A|nr:hypothetical protein [Methanohalophilus levihalophilus]MBP2030434.1 hypothetical protein [Methanohalophilus levihalophilus]
MARYFFCAFMIFVVISSTLFATVVPVSSKEFIQPSYGYTTNYYEGYGVPDIYASVLGDNEFERGETSRISIVLSNRGILYGFESKTSVEGSQSEQQLALAELEYETARTIAYGIKATLVSPIEMIDVDPLTSGQTLEKLVPGELPSQPLTYTISISDDAPAGDYVLMLPVSYEFQDDVQMTGGSAVQLGLPDVDHTVYYKETNATLPIPITIKEAPLFSVQEIEGELVAGQSSTINITYRNDGELAANDVIARIVVMTPLATSRPTVSLSDMEPGETETASFIIDASSTAIAKNYGLDSELRYIDEDGDVAFSENLKIEVPLTSPDGGVDIGRASLAGTFLVALYMIIDTIRKRRKIGEKEE